MTAKNRNPVNGEIWRWIDDGSGTHEYYGAGICLGWIDGYEGIEGPEGYVTFNFAERGVFNIPVEMVHRLMKKVK